MDELQITATTNNPLGVILVESINNLVKIVDIITATVATTVYTKTIILNIGTGQIALGSTFTPELTKQPSFYNAMKVEANGSGTDYSNIISGFVRNADDIHWDITFADSVDEVTDLIINVQ
jgi:hypothetical protein